MLIHSDINQIPAFRFPVVTSGTFDGVHIGHQSIFKELVAEAKKNQGESVVLTFDPHPRLVLNPGDASLTLLTTLEERIRKIQKLGVDHLIIIQFTKSFSELSSSVFLDDYLLKKIRTKMLVVGHDHHFGKNREGKYELLKEVAPSLGFEIREIKAAEKNHIPVSSSLIRKALHQGDIRSATEMLGEPYALHAEIVEGHKIGRSLGFPTANLMIKNKQKLIPSNGVYAVSCQIQGYEKIFHGMLNIGFRPTFSEEQIRNIELHIIEFNDIIYGKEISVYFNHYLRNEKKFSGTDALKAQLESDKINTLKFFETSDIG